MEGALMDFRHWCPDYFITNQTRCLEILNILPNRFKIPFLNYLKLETISQIADGQLVHFRGMIQDVMETEMYSEIAEIRDGDNTRLGSFKYRDYIPLDEWETLSTVGDSLSQRRKLLGITIPGMNKWARDVEKRMTNAVGGAYAQCEEVVDDDYLASSPIKSQLSKIFLIELYKDFERYPIGTMVDVIGFLSTPRMADDETFDEYNILPYPSIHAISIQSIENINPLIYSMAVESTFPYEIVYEDLKNTFRMCLFGDELASKYLMCTLLSGVLFRNNIGEVIGSLPLNLMNIPDNYVDLLYSVIQSLIPVSHYYPMSLENLENTSVRPRKDNRVQKMVAGEMQLAAHTLVIVDETRLNPGCLNTAGLAAVNEITDVIRNQQLSYEMDNYTKQYDVDLQWLVLSRGRSILSMDCQIPVKPDTLNNHSISETIKNVKNLLSHGMDDRINIFRKFLSMQMLHAMNITQSDREMITDDFVRMIRVEYTTLDDVNNVLALAKLVGKCHGKKHLDKAIWIETCEMELDRKIRLINYNKK